MDKLSEADCPGKVFVSRMAFRSVDKVKMVVTRAFSVLFIFLFVN